jgi:O-antigen/teichoic acid export membrane protein
LKSGAPGETQPVRETADGVRPSQPTRSIVGSGAVFALALGLQRVLNLALLPVYARFLSPTAYGQLSVVAAIATIATSGFSFGMDVATVLAWYRLADNPALRSRWLSSVGAFMTAAPICGCAIASAAVLALSPRPFGLPAWWLVLALMGAGLGVTATTVPLALLRAQQRLGPYLSLTGVIAIVNTAASLVFIAVLHWGVAGWLAGTLLGYACGLLVAIPTVPWPVSRRAGFDARAVRQALRFGLPLVPNLLSHWVLQVADRTILVGIVSGVALGQYTLAVNLTITITVLTTAMAQASMPTFARTGVSQVEGSNSSQLTARLVGVTGVVGLAAAALLPLIIDNLLPGGYHGAAQLCGWLALGFTLAGLYQIPVNVITLVAGKSAWVWPITFLAGAADIVLVLVWCPTGGVRAAAIATAISYGLLLVGMLLLALRVAGRRHFAFRPAIVSCAVCLAAGYASSTLSDRTIVGAVIRIALVIVAGSGVARVSGIRVRGIPSPRDLVATGRTRLRGS